MMMVVGVLALVLTGATGITVNMIRGFKHTSTQMDADQSASLALQNINRDLQEAKQVTVLSQTSMRVYYPAINADGSYNRNVLDTVNYVDFYRANANGSQNVNGKYLWRKPAGSSGRALSKDVVDLLMESTSPSSVDVTLKTERKSGGVTGRCEMVNRTIFLRNY